MSKVVVNCRRLVLFLVALGGLLPARASWYWPFDFDPDSTNKPPRLHRLLEKANDYIERAEDEALEGNGDKAVENYRLALGELTRVELENPDRADTPEFAPLRTKRASCSAAIDAIRFAQVNENERAVSVTNTKDLEKRWRKKHGMQTPEDLEEEAREKAAAEKRKAEKKAEEKKESTEEGEPEAKKVEEKKPAEKKPEAKPPADSNAFEGRLQKAVDKIRSGDYAAADRLLEKLLQERPKDLKTLLLRAAAQAGVGSNYAARRTLETAMRVHPKSYLPYYNLANLSLRLGEGAESARQYYEMGRSVGGPVNAALEEALK